MVEPMVPRTGYSNLVCDRDSGVAYTWYHILLSILFFLSLFSFFSFPFLFRFLLLFFLFFLIFSLFFFPIDLSLTCVYICVVIGITCNMYTWYYFLGGKRYSRYSRFFKARVVRLKYQYGPGAADSRFHFFYIFWRRHELRQL